jgi:hypothetical protein
MESIYDCIRTQKHATMAFFQKRMNPCGWIKVEHILDEITTGLKSDPSYLEKLISFIGVFTSSYTEAFPKENARIIILPLCVDSIGLKHALSVSIEEWVEWVYHNFEFDTQDKLESIKIVLLLMLWCDLSLMDVITYLKHVGKVKAHILDFPLFMTKHLKPDKHFEKIRSIEDKINTLLLQFKEFDANVFSQPYLTELFTSRLTYRCESLRNRGYGKLFISSALFAASDIFSSVAADNVSVVSSTCMDPKKTIFELLSVRQIFPPIVDWELAKLGYRDIGFTPSPEVQSRRKGQRRFSILNGSPFAMLDHLAVMKERGLNVSQVLDSLFDHRFFVLANDREEFVNCIHHLKEIF